MPAPPPSSPVDSSSLVWDALVGRGLRPASLWASAVFLPCVSACVFAKSSAVLYETDLHLVYALALMVCVWTVPWEWVAGILVDVGKLRECLADCLPLMPGLLPYLPQMLPPLLLNIFTVAPHAGALAPYLKHLLKHPKFVAKALPILIPKIDIMADMIDDIGPHFANMDERHYAKLELIIQDLVDQIEVLKPHFHIICPHIVEISLRADKLFPIVNYLLPHAEACKDHIGWLIPFSDIEGFDEFLPYLDALVPHIETFAPYGPMLLPYVGKMRKHIPILIENAGTLLPQLGGAIDHIDPLIYWLSDLLPLANSVGILRSNMLLNAGMPFLKFLPPIPESQRTILNTADSALKVAAEADVDKFRQSEARRVVSLPKTHRVGKVVFFVVNVDGRYAGEFRYSALRELNRVVHNLPSFKKPIPVFPGRSAFGLSEDGVEERRIKLEEYLRFVLSEPDICCTKEFVAFVRANRKWDKELPLLTSPLMF